MAKASASTKAFETRAQTMGTRLQTVGSGMSRVGKGLTTFVSLPLAAVGAAAIKTAVDFESAFAGVRKTVEGTEPQLRALEQGIMKMSERLPASVEEISAVAEAAGQLGIKRGAILGFTETMVDLGETTDLTADNAAVAMARIANIMQTPQKNIDRLGATLVGLGNAGASTESEIAAMSMRIAGAGVQVGMTEGEVLGFANALSSVGVEAQAGGSAISRVMIDIVSSVEAGGDKLRGFADVAGMAPTNFAKAFKDDAAGAIITFVEGLAKIKKEGGDVFGTLEKLGLSEIRVRDALLRASGAGDLFRESLELGNQAWKENSALTEEANKRYKTNAARFEMVKNQVRNAAARIGEDLLPIVKDTVKVIADLTESFSNLDPGLRKNIVKWGLLAIAMGPILRILGGIVSLGGKATSVIGKIAGAGATAAAGKSAVGAAAAGGGAAGVGALAASAGPAVAAAGLALSAKGADVAVDRLRGTVEKYGGTSKETAAEVKNLSGLMNSGTGDAVSLQQTQASLNAEVEDAARAHRRYVNRLTGTTGAVRNYDEATRRATGVSDRQREEIGTLIGAFHKLTGGISDSTVKQVSNMLAMGDAKGAIRLLKGELNDILGTYGGFSGRNRQAQGALSATATRAEMARLKVSGLNRELAQVPNTKTVSINVQTNFTQTGIGPQGFKPLPNRQMGGPVSAGRSYIVGESGPERFTPGTSGHMTSNKDLGGDVFHINVRADSTTNASKLARVIREEIVQARQEEVRDDRARLR